MTSKAARLAGIILESLAETETGSAPESYCVLPLQNVGVSLDDWHALKAAMLDCGWITIEPGPRVQLTQKGWDLTKGVTP